MKQKVKQLFEYLLALRHLTSQPIRELKRYEKYWMLDELPVGEGCFLGGDGVDKDAYLEVHQQIFKNDYPSFDSELGRLLELLQFDYTKDGSVVSSVEELEGIMNQQYEQLQNKLNEEQTHKVELTQWERFLIQYSEKFIELAEAQEKIKDANVHMLKYLKAYEQWIEDWINWAHTQKQKCLTHKLYDYFIQQRQMMNSE